MDKPRDQELKLTETSVVDGLHYESGKPVRIEIADGIIRNILEQPSAGVSGKSLYVAPGLIDNQVNGYHGVDFADQQLSIDRIKNAAQALWREGVTTFVPTLVTASHDDLVRNFGVLAKASEDPFFNGSITGFHLEGPYLSPEPGYCGCHPAQHLRNPSWEEFMVYQEAAGGKIVEVTVAPELDGAIDFIRLCSQNGIVAALGHTNATADQINSAVENGARLSTHLGNGCANLIDRRRNPLWPQLANDRLTPSLIADGHHLTPEELRVFYKVKGPEDLILTSDVIHLRGLPPGEYTYLGAKVTLTAEGLVMNPELKCLAGASLPLIRGVENMMICASCSLGVAVNLASRNVARVLGIADRGKIAPGKRADLILLEKGENRLEIKKIYLKGVQVRPNSTAEGSPL